MLVDPPQRLIESPLLHQHQPGGFQRPRVAARHAPHFFDLQISIQAGLRRSGPADIEQPGDCSRGNGGPASESLTVDLPRIERAVREILAAVGEDPDREGLLETPARVARMYAEMFSGLKQDPRIHTQKFFTEEYDEVVLVRDISFCSMCEHHLLPFMGM